MIVGEPMGGQGVGTEGTAQPAWGARSHWEGWLKGGEPTCGRGRWD